MLFNPSVAPLALPPPGQTSSGKTFTLIGTEEHPGVILCSIYAAFEAIQSASFSNFLVRISYIEIYNEEIKDLLAEDQSPANMSNLKIVEDPKTGPFVKNSVEKVVESAEQIIDLIKVALASLNLPPPTAVTAVISGACSLGDCPCRLGSGVGRAGSHRAA